MKKHLSFSLLLFAQILFAQEYATTDSGKRVELLKNGTYKYIKEIKQQNSQIKPTDIVASDDKVKFITDSFFIKNGDDKLTSVKILFSSPSEKYKAVSLEKINLMIATVNIKAMYAVKNKSTYVPKNISLFYSVDSNEWTGVVEYTAQNDYGATKDGKVFCMFDEVGEFKNILIP